MQQAPVPKSDVSHLSTSLEDVQTSLRGKERLPATEQRLIYAPRQLKKREELSSYDNTKQLSPGTSITFLPNLEWHQKERERRIEELLKFRVFQEEDKLRLLAEEEDKLRLLAEEEENLRLLDAGSEYDDAWTAEALAKRTEVEAEVLAKRAEVKAAAALAKRAEVEAEVEAELPPAPIPPLKDTQIKLQAITFMLFGTYDPNGQLMAMNEPDVFFENPTQSIMKQICERDEFIQLVEEYVKCVGNNWRASASGDNYSMIKGFYTKIQKKIKKHTEKKKKKREQIETIIEITKQTIQDIKKDIEKAIKAANKKSQHDGESHDELDIESEEETVAAKLLGKGSVLHRMRAKDQIKRKQDKAVQEQLNRKKKEKKEAQKKLDKQKKLLEANKYLDKKAEKKKSEEHLKILENMAKEKREREDEDAHKQRMLDALKTPPQLPFAATALGHIVTYGIMFGTGATTAIEALNKIPGLKDIPIPQLVTTAPDGSDPPPSSLDDEDDETDEDDLGFDPAEDLELLDRTDDRSPPLAAVVPVMKCPRENQKYCKPKTKNQDWCVPNDDTVKEAKLDDLPQDACDWNRSQFGLAEGKLGDYFGGKPNWRSHCTPAGLGDTCGRDSGSAATAAVAPSKKREKKSHLKGLLQDAVWATGDSKQQIKNTVSTAGLQVGQPYKAGHMGGGK
jgi:hypothetical protein